MDNSRDKNSWTRRRFIKTGILAGLGILVADAFWLEKYFIEIKEYYLGKAGPDQSDIKVVQISDLHIKSLNAQLIQLAKKLNIIKPNLVFITGDAVDDPKKPDELDEFVSLIDMSIKKVAILGNWEYWGKIDLVDLKSVYVNNNCDLLINSTAQYFFRGKSIAITGLDDYVGGNADISLAVNGFRESDYHIILNHCPQYNDKIQDELPKDIPVDFILSGHTHGGQINFFGLVPFKPQGSGKYLKGWYRDSRINFYVSKGIGTSILPIRFMARAEVAIFNLKV